jgi:hypothetical protein
LRCRHGASPSPPPRPVLSTQIPPQPILSGRCLDFASEYITPTHLGVICSLALNKHRPPPRAPRNERDRWTCDDHGHRAEPDQFAGEGVLKALTRLLFEERSGVSLLRNYIHIVWGSWQGGPVTVVCDDSVSSPCPDVFFLSILLALERGWTGIVRQETLARGSSGRSRKYLRIQRGGFAERECRRTTGREATSLLPSWEITTLKRGHHLRHVGAVVWSVLKNLRMGRT